MIGEIMRVNIIALIAVTVAIIALFLPWLSLNHVGFANYTFLEGWSFSPFQSSFGSIWLNASTNSVVSNSGTMTCQPKPLFRYAGGYLIQTPELFMFLVTLLYLFATGLMIQTSFATDSWSKTGKRVSVAASNLLFLSIFLYTLSVGSFMLTNFLGLGYPIPSVNSTLYLDLGFWVAIFGAGLAFASWLHPKFIAVNIQPYSKVASTFRRWLPVAEWEKSAVMAVVSFLAVLIFAIVYIPLP